jgi:hypothetical protein
MLVTLPTTTQCNNPRINIKPVKYKWNFENTVQQLIIRNFSLYKIRARTAQLVWQLATGWKDEASEPRHGQGFSPLHVV